MAEVKSTEASMQAPNIASSTAELSPEARRAELAKIQREIAAQRALLEKKLAETRTMENKLFNYGPGLSGKKKFDLPKIPQRFTSISVSNMTSEPQRREGLVELTFDQFAEYCWMIDNIQRNEEFGKYGIGRPERIVLDSDKISSPFF